MRLVPALVARHLMASLHKLTASPRLVRAFPRAQPAMRTVPGTGIVLSTHDRLEAVEAIWRAFQERADMTAFQCFDWLAAWQASIGAQSGVRPAIVLGQSAAGEPLFILPLAISSSGLLHRIGFLGGDYSDYNAPILAPQLDRIVDPAQFALIWREALQLIRINLRLRLDIVDLRKMPETVGDQRNPFLALPVHPNASGAHAAGLAPSWEAFYAKRSSATRRRDRTKLRRLGEHGAVAFVVPQTDADKAATLDTLYNQKSRSLARIGAPDIFASQELRRFLTGIATDPGLRGFVHVSRLDVGQDTVATNLGLSFRGCYHYVFASHTDTALARFGPGAAHLREIMRNAIESGHTKFDFTIGDEPYKREWSNLELRLFDHIAAAAPHAQPIALLIRAAASVKRFIKTTPALWQLFRKARSIKAELRGWIP